MHSSHAVTNNLQFRNQSPQQVRCSDPLQFGRETRASACRLCRGRKARERGRILVPRLTRISHQAIVGTHRFDCTKGIASGPRRRPHPFSSERKPRHPPQGDPSSDACVSLGVPPLVARAIPSCASPSSLRLYRSHKLSMREECSLGRARQDVGGRAPLALAFGLSGQPRRKPKQ